jgi:hypothetical protein
MNDFLQYIQSMHSNKTDKIKIKLDLLYKQINYAKNICEKFNLEIKPSWLSFLYGDFKLYSMDYHINYRSLQVDHYLPIFRILPDDYPKIKYGEKNIIAPNCHDGQRKLLFSEIEFYSLIQKKYKLNEILVVYVGAADGTHQSIIFDLFPDLDFYLCDANRFNIKHK